LIEVAVDLPVHATFTYEVPADLIHHIAIGQRVLVPFGRRRVTGYIIRMGCPAPQMALKPIIELLDDEPLFPIAMLAFFQWIAGYYIHPLGEVIQAALPSGINLADQVRYALTETGRQALADPNAPAEATALAQCLTQGPGPLAALKRAAGPQFSPSVLAVWVKKGWLERQHTLAGGRTRPKTLRFVVPNPVFHGPDQLSASRRSIWDALMANGPMAISDLKTVWPTAASLVSAMAKDGQVLVQEQVVYRDPLGTPITPDQAPALTVEQRQAVAALEGALDKGFQTFLLAGVTGSGKTEIYLHLAAKALQRGLSVLVLVPEIALISQTERAFRARFGETVALLHSGLSDGERFDQWHRIRRQEAAIAVGARSAIFAPFAEIGLIIVDEEHDDSYKQEGALRYNARDMAVVRGQQLGSVVILGSATPSLQSAYNAQNGKFCRINLHERVVGRTMPQIHVEDLTAIREEQGMRRYLTPALLSAMQETLARKEQVLIFLNRRGFANTLVCATCGQAQRCEHCDISLTYHQRHNAYLCHYCGYSRAAITRCGRCGSEHIQRLGLGTERLEGEIQKRFPGAQVARMDRDTTRHRGALVKLLKGLRERKIDILIGTQMVAKGHDYPHITLVGIICADLSLSLPDFRAGERTFQLLAQVAGRAGRGQTPGRVILQTYNPLHFSITAAREQDFDAFYRQEIEFRKALGYPPITRMIQLRINGRQKAQVADYARQMGERCRHLLSQQHSPSPMEVLGPIEAPLTRIAGQYRWQILIKGHHSNALHAYVRQLLFGPDGMAGKGGISVSVDVDPVFLM
jgi:primosomal protein N' (replication factor Y)